MTTLHNALRAQGSDSELAQNLALAQLAIIVLAMVYMALGAV